MPQISQISADWGGEIAEIAEIAVIGKQETLPLISQIRPDDRRSKEKDFTAKCAKERKGDQGQAKFETARRRPVSNVNSETANRKPTKEEIIAAIQQCTTKLGHVPSQEELKAETGIYGKIFARHFGNYTKALRASGFEGRGAGFTLDMDELFQEWAGIVRKIGETPSASDYVLHSQHSLTPLRKRFRYWNDVPAGMVQYAVENGLEEQWADVLEVARKYRREARTGGWRRKPGVLSSNPRILTDRPVYGEHSCDPRWALPR